MPRRFCRLLRRLPLLKSSSGATRASHFRSPLTASASQRSQRRPLLRVNTQEIFDDNFDANDSFDADVVSSPPTPKAETFIRALPLVPIRTLLPESQTCGICMDIYLEGDKEEQPIRLPCGHVIGEKCISTWLNPQSSLLGASKNTCPFCRFELFPLVHESWEEEILVPRPPRRAAPLHRHAASRVASLSAPARHRLRERRSREAALRMQTHLLEATLHAHGPAPSGIGISFMSPRPAPSPPHPLGTGTRSFDWNTDGWLIY